MRQLKYFCDGCGKEFPSSFYFNNLKHNYSWWVFEKHEDFEFCKDCAIKLQEFLKEFHAN